MSGEQEAIATPEMNEDDLLASAFDEQPASEQHQDQEPAPEQPQPRDPVTQRFMPKAKAEGEGAEQPEKGTTEPPEKDHRIPIRELLDERDRRQAAERRAQELERQWAEWQRQQQQPEPEPDPYDPDGYRAWLQSQQASAQETIATEMRNWRVNMTFHDAHEQHKEEFEAAYEALRQAPPNVREEVMDAINPGKALMRWHGSQKVITEANGDFDGYVNRKLDERLKDPEVRRRIFEEMQAEARGNDRSTQIVIPSVNRATGGGNSRPGSLPVTDGDFFQDAVSGIGRR